MPDAERARRLALVAGAVLVVLAYGLGGASLYVREHLLNEGSTGTPLPSATAATEVSSASGESPSPAPTTAGEGQPTLVPTLTPGAPD